jgi:hypothetical protein
MQAQMANENENENEKNWKVNSIIPSFYHSIILSFYHSIIDSLQSLKMTIFCLQALSHSSTQAFNHSIIATQALPIPQNHSLSKSCHPSLKTVELISSY